MVSLISLDVGTKRIGVAVADTIVPIASPLTTVVVDGTELEVIKNIIKERAVEKVVVGYPRNQSGDPTEQTTVSEAFGNKLQDVVEVVYQDESVTSVAAENLLKTSGKPYGKGDIDALAASIILQDYLEANHAA
ncbi:MAG: Holliday junction resolvase RuvX [Candidatus Nomurabacteria bacterium]|nr:MAG: Holliday junction resolvase RuvX [Candidatus Nomurabacteria bacterium]